MVFAICFHPIPANIHIPDIIQMVFADYKIARSRLKNKLFLPVAERQDPWGIIF
jgi:hypothetical protein